MEETNGNDIRTPDNVDTATSDSAGILPAPSGTDQRGVDHEFHNEACGCMPVPEPVTVTVNDTDLGASKPIPQPKPTSKQIGEWRNANFTVRHSTVNACGHKLDLRQFPSNANCWDCWEAFFSVSPEGVASVHQLLLEGGTKAVIAMHGVKFTKMFGKFLQQKLLKEYASQEAASGIEGSILDVKEEVNATQLSS